MRALLITLLFFSACKSGPPTLEEAIKAYKPKIAPKLAAMNKIITRPFPTVTKDEMHPQGAVTLFNPRPAGGKAASGNALMINADTIGNLTRESYASIKLGHEINDCAAILESGKMADGQRQATGFWAEEAFKVCAMIRYVFVVEEGAITRPSTNTAAKTFTPGTYQGKVHGYDLETGEYFGSAAINATTPDKVTNYRAEAYSSDAVDGMFLSTAVTGVKVALKKALPSIDLN